MPTLSPISSASPPPPLPSSSTTPPPSDASPPSPPPPHPSDVPPPDSTPPPSPSLPAEDSPPTPPDSAPPPPPDSPSSQEGSNNPPVAPESPLDPLTPSLNSSPPPLNYSPPAPYLSPPSGELSPHSSSPPPPPPKKHRSPPPPSTVISPTSSNSSSGSPTTQIPQKVPSPPSLSIGFSPPGSSITHTPDNSGSSGGVSPSTAAAIGAAAAVVVILLAMAIWCMRRRKQYDGGYPGEYRNPSPLTSSQVSGTSTPFRKTPSVTNMLPNSTSQLNIHSPSDNGMGNSKSWFTYEELSQATNGFSFSNILGEGGFGCVYKGFLPDGREVAVKQLKVGGSQGEREFQAEVEIISRVHHRHLVSLVGYCISENQRLLVYDFVPNNTLYYHLHGKGKPVMDWPTRVKVAAGAARGLAYLHEDCHPRIIHRDIKSSNILLDNNFEAQVADFGLAKLTEDTNTHISTRVMGTFGYLAPEYASSGKLTDRSDVFSFGVVLLELITGRKPVDSSQPLGEESLVEWARPLMLSALETLNVDDNLPDPKLGKEYSENEMFQIIEVASACIRYNAQMRPRMGRVMRALDNMADAMSMDINNGVKPGQTQVFNGPTNVQDMKNFHRMAFGSRDYSSDFSKNSVL